jgi:8-oxo-dGTP diphosphatase
VVGFAFDKYRANVLLIRKLKPAWQAGRLNGVGGKVEPGESDAEAMVREFHEETGWVTSPVEWRQIAEVVSGDAEIVFFRRRVDLGVREFRAAFSTSPEAEQLVVIHWADAEAAGALPNLSWLLPLARYEHDVYEPIRAVEVSRG